MGPKLQKYHRALQNRIDAHDSKWAYELSDLPLPHVTDAAGLVKCIAVISNKDKQQINLNFEPVGINRALSADPLHNFIKISFGDFRLRLPKPGDGAVSEPATAKESQNYIARLLHAGIQLNGTDFNFYGHSNSQLKSRSCFLFAASKSQISDKVNALGDFSKIKTVAKKAKRIGLLFSVADTALTLDPDRCEDIPDVKAGDYIFTDGCGLISPHLAKQLVKQLRLTFRNLPYRPAVFQIRYRGYKGVLTLDPRLKGKILAQFRESMRKFRGGENLSFAVVDYSKPYSFGRLNDEIILLLHSLGISDSVLLSKQAAHFKLLSEASALDPQAAFRFLSYANEPQLAERVLLEGPEIVATTSNYHRLISREFTDMINKRDEQRCRILIPKSRLLFGVCDPIGCLRPGECFVRVTTDGDGQPRTLINTEVLVTRNPCLHPGDLQKFTVREKSELSHLVDCIVFPTCGARPSADLMSGGDLDGDKFFVCWDSDLIPSTIAQAASYPGPKEKFQPAAVTDKDRLEYFAQANNASLGRVKNLYLKWARYGNPLSAECQQLNRLFSQCVDGNRIKVPEALEKPPEPPEDAPPFILDLLHKAALHEAKNRQILTKTINGYSMDALEILLSTDNAAMSEFELVKIAFKWCLVNSVPFTELVHHFDFNLLNDQHKAWATATLPMDTALVQNSLLQSNLVHEDELRPFRLNDSRLHWKRIFDSNSERMARFLEVTTKALDMFHRKLILFRADERLTLGIYIPCKVDKSEEFTVDTRVRVLSFPHTQGREAVRRRTMPTRANYKVYCDENVFQMFEGQRRNTWIHLRRAPSDDTTYRGSSSERARRQARQETLESGINHDLIASVALDKCSRDLQQHVGRMNRNPILQAELYVITNKDVAALRALDLWLEYVDTTEKLPLFQEAPREYENAAVEHVQWDETPTHIASIVRDDDLSGLTALTQADLRGLFAWLHSHGEKTRLYMICKRLLQAPETLTATTLDDVVDIVLDIIVEAPYLTLALTKSGACESLSHRSKQKLAELAPEVLRAIVLHIDEMGELALAPFDAILSVCKYITFADFAKLTEVIALTVLKPDHAMTLLVENLERASGRILVGRPRVVQRLVRSLTGIALDHIDEAGERKDRHGFLVELKVKGLADGMHTAEAQLRIDLPAAASLAMGDHVKLTPATAPSNKPRERLVTIDALVSKLEQGFARFRCVQKLPAFTEKCSWTLTNCGSFTSSKAMFDATLAFLTEYDAESQLYGILTGAESLPCLGQGPTAPPNAADNSYDDLNASQRAAVSAAVAAPVTCLWGPPGTGKTHTICTLLQQLITMYPDSRILVTAPTNNAVDNVMRKFTSTYKSTTQRLEPIRVSTDVRKVSDDLKRYTCDSMLGLDINERPDVRKKAEKQVKKCSLVFTTCIGAGLGLLRNEQFQIVLIDEASQVTEAASYVPLAKGCEKLVLVGDHVQLRPTVGQHALAVDFDESLFERLYRGPDMPGLAKVMLDTQYRMHEALCEFSSREFYEGNLKTAVAASDRLIPRTAFEWSAAGQDTLAGMRVFVQCSDAEDLGHRSKSNAGQAKLCQKICSQLDQTLDADGKPAEALASRLTIAVLTPYTRQRELLQPTLAGVEVSSIDGFQGKEADIIIFVTVRCNASGDIGFLKDERRLNVALTRARRGLIVIGDRATLTRGVEQDANAVWKRLLAWLPTV